MKLNIAYPSTGAQKTVDIDDEKKIAQFFDKRISQEVDLSFLGEPFEGYIAKITGGHDKQGFPMRQGVLVPSRVRLLLPVGPGNRRGVAGERKRRSVRGCIVAHDISVLHLVLVKKGASDIDGLTDKIVPRRLGPKRANKIRKLFNLSKDDDVRKSVIRRVVPRKDASKKPKLKAPKIQRLITPERLKHKRQLLKEKLQRRERAIEAAKQYAAALEKKRQERHAAAKH